MQRARRFALVALMALMGGFAVTGCQSNASDLAVQVGDARWTNSQVDDIVTRVDVDRVATLKAQPTPTSTPTSTATPAAPANPATPTSTEDPVGLASEQVGPTRQRVVQFILFNELARRYAAEKGLAFTAPDYTSLAPQLGLPADNPYVKLAADSDAYRTLLLTKVSAAIPTEADLVDAYARVKKASPDAPSYAELKPQLVALPDLGQGIALRAELDAAMKRYGVTLNPRYEPIEIPLIVVSAGNGV
jgi:hypothetical protein